jgi:hypothetical protein
VFSLAAGSRAFAAAESRKLTPPPVQPKDRALATLLTRLRNIVSKKDAPALLSLMGPTFRVGFDAGKGPAAFQSVWQPELESSELWPLLERLLALGGTFYSRTLFCIPYVYTQFPVDLDPLSHVVVIRDQVAVRRSPDESSAVVAHLSHDIVRTAQDLAVPVRLEREAWVAVITSAGESGFVAARDVYSPAEYRVFFEKQKGVWRWLSLACAE